MLQEVNFPETGRICSIKDFCRCSWQGKRKAVKVSAGEDAVLKGLLGMASR